MKKRMKKGFLLSFIIISIMFVSFFNWSKTTKVEADNNHYYYDIELTAWTSSTSLPTTLGAYYLDTDVTLSSTWIVPSASEEALNPFFILCLNGHVIKSNGGNFSLITIYDDAYLTITDCDDAKEHKGYVDANGLWHLGEKGQLGEGEVSKTIYGGIITGGTCLTEGNEYGGAINVVGGVFSLDGGTIVGNTANYGGGVMCNYNATTEKTSEFSFNSGNIQYNTAKSGAGIYVGANCQTYLSGGNISYNTAKTPENNSIGGGVCIGYNSNNDGGMVILQGSQISHNYADFGGGIYVCPCNNSSLSFFSGYVTNNTAQYGGGIYSQGQTNIGDYQGDGKIYITLNTAKVAGGGFLNLTNNIQISNKLGYDIIIKDNICENTYNDGKLTYPKNFATSEPVTISYKLSDNTEIYYSYINGDYKHDKGMLTTGYSNSNPDALVDSHFIYDGPSTFTASLKKNEYSQKNEIYIDSELEIINTRIEANKNDYHGYLEISKTSAKSNDTITINVHTNNGCTLKEGSLKVTYINNSKINEVKLTKASNDTYTFIMPNFEVTVEADFIAYQTHDNITFESWSKKDSLPTKAGNYYLDFNVVLTSDWVVPTGILNLCLNGKVIDLNSKNFTDRISIVVNENTTLNIYDCDTTTIHKFGDYYDFWTYDESLSEPAHTLTGGLITKGYNSAIIVNSGVLNVYGGNIAGNKGREYGGAIQMVDGIVNINGGIFAGNDGNIYGGAISCVNGLVTVNDGTFISNSISGAGGAIYVSNGTLVINDGIFKNHNCSCTIAIENGEFIMNDGIITENTDWNSGGAGVCTYNSTFTMNGGEISKNEAPMGMGGGIYIYGGLFTLNGGLITENIADAVGAGVYLEPYSIFVMNDGEISYNTCNGSGGGVFVSEGAKFIMHNGEISYNESIEKSGGGVAVQYNGYFLADGGIITKNVAYFNGGGVYISDYTGDSEVETCLAKGTPITLKDGTTCLIEELEKGDEIRVFDHETGTISYSKVFDIWKFPSPRYDAVTLHFTNYIDVTIVGGHCFFEKTAQKYVNVNVENVESYIGSEFYNADFGRYETLESVTYINEPVETYILVSENNYNSIANGMLSNVDGLYTVLSNIFDFDADLKWNASQKADDIKKYGTWNYDNDHFHYVNEDTYKALNLKYLSVAIGKGLLTLDELRKAAENTLNYNLELVKEDLFDEVGIYLGGTIKIKENVSGDLLLWNDGPGVHIGTGIIGNGCKCPEEGMEVYISVLDCENAFVCDSSFTLNASSKDTKYFIPNEEGYVIKFCDNNTPKDSSDDYLKFGYEYEITNNSSEADKDTNHGYVTFDDEIHFEGDVITLSIFANEGSVLKTIKYNDGTQDIVINENGGIYSFVMPKANITITAVFETVVAYNKNTSIEYYSLEQAILDAEDLDTIIIVENLVTDRIETGNKSLTFKPESKNITIKLNGPMLFGVNDSNKTFTLSGGDNKETLTINVEQEEGINNFRPIAIRVGNTLVLKTGVILSGSNMENIGGGMINVASNAVLRLEGGIIENSKVTSTDYDIYHSILGRGGAIFVNENATFIMTGGEIRNCSATVAGGAIYSKGIVKITGGKITNCLVTGLDDNGVVKAKGGAIYLMSGSFEMTGGAISGNKLSNVEDMRGAGLYCATGVNVKLGGSSVIADNKNGLNDNSNLFLYDGVVFEILSGDLAPTDSMSVGIGTKTAPVKGTNVKISLNGTSKDEDYFFQDNLKEYIKFDEDALYLCLNTDVTFDSEYEINNGEGITYGDEFTIDNPTYDYFGETVTVELVKKFYVLDDSDWKLLDSAPTNHGNYKVVFEVSDDYYTGSLEFPFTINKKTITLAITDVNTGTYKYDGTAKTTVVTYDSLAGTDELTYELEYSDNINAGTCNVSIKSATISNGLADNYNIVMTDTGVIVIDKADMVVGINILAPSVPFVELVYDGHELELLSAGLTFDEKDLSSFGTFYYSLDGKTYTTSIPTAIYSGEFNPVWYFVGDDNHNGIGSEAEPISQLFSVEILKANQATAKVVISDYEFDGIVSAPSIDVSLLEKPTLTYFYSKTNSNTSGTEFINITNQTLSAGEYYMYVVVGETQNYAGYTSQTTKFEIKKGNLTNSTKDVSINYDGLDHANLNEIETNIIIKDSLKASVVPTSKLYSFDGINYFSSTDIDWNEIVAKNAGTYKVYYKYSYDNFNDVNDSFTLTINKIMIKKPVADSTEFEFDGTIKTYTLSSNDLYTITGELEKTNAGSSTIIVSIKDKTNYCWADNTDTDLTFDFVVAKKAITLTITDVNTGTYKYDGTAKTTVVTYDSLVGTDELTYELEYSDNINAGTCNVSIKSATISNGLADNYNIVMTDTGVIVIDKAESTINTDNVNKTYTYTESNQTVNSGATLNHSEGTLVYSNNVLSNVGTYNVTISVEETNNFNANSVNVEVVVNKAKVVEPTITESYKYTGSPITVSVNGVKEFMSTSDSLTQKNPGVYTITYTLDSNHEWELDSDGIVEWEIKPTSITPKDSGKDENEKQDVIVEFEEGFTNDVEVVVEITLELEVNAKALTVDYYNIQDENLKLNKNEKVGVVFDVKLVQIVNGVKVNFQPEDIAPGTKIKVNMLIPESVNIKKVLKILHVHSENDIDVMEFDINKVDANRYYQIEVDKLSEFAFIYKDNGNAWVHFILIAILAVGGLLFAYFKFMMKNEFFALISTGSSLVLSIVLSFFGDCAACTVFSIIDISLFALLSLYLIYNKFIKKNKEKEKHI